TGQLDGAQFRVVVSNSAASLTSNAATLFVPTVCDYSVTGLPGTFSRDGGAQMVSVTASAGCVWSATSASLWGAMAPGGTGSGTIAVTTGPNFGAQTRNASVTIAGTTFPIAQTGGALPKLFDPGLANALVLPVNFNNDGYQDLFLYNQVTGSWLVKIG